MSWVCYEHHISTDEENEGQGVMSKYHSLNPSCRFQTLFSFIASCHLLIDPYSVSGTKPHSRAELRTSEKNEHAYWTRLVVPQLGFDVSHDFREIILFLWV